MEETACWGVPPLFIEEEFPCNRSPTEGNLHDQLLPGEEYFQAEESNLLRIPSLLQASFRGLWIGLPPWANYEKVGCLP
ncbi:UNVERIFIED_CONTAM: hypothetical protein Sindi_2307800 [Sesamum indicum]